MIDYELYCRIRTLHRERGLSFAQIARELGLHAQTVSRHARATGFVRPVRAPRASKLDPYRPVIARLLDRHPYSAVQILQRLRADYGYNGGYSILKDHLRRVRPPRAPAFLTLAFAPGECAQLDWGYGGSLAVGATRRRLSFFVMVLCHSRMMYLEFSLGEATEHLLGCHANAFEFFHGVPAAVMIDNPRTAVLLHPRGERAVFQPRYLDFAAHCGFQPRACNVGQAHEKGRVENAVGYVKKNFLAGLDPAPGLAAMNLAARNWLDTVANVRIHAQTRRRPSELFAEERAHLRALPAIRPEVSVTRSVRVTNRCRVSVDTNRYSVPSLYASRLLTLRLCAERVQLYHEGRLVASHPRSYERHRDFEDPDHLVELLAHRRRARDAALLLRFYALCPRAEDYHRQMRERRLNPTHHVAKILALAEIHGRDAVARAIDDAFEFQAFSSEYIANILAQRERLRPEPSPLHLTRRQDLLELDPGPANLCAYHLHPSQPDSESPDPHP